MKTSKLARSFELAKLAAQVGLRELRSKDLPSRIEQAKILAESLSQLKGAAMKAGQLLSLELNDYFPKEAADILSVLQQSALAVPFTEVQKVLLKELGPQTLAKIFDIEPIPLGVASIGQVHGAKFEKQNIVLKVQYDGVAESIESDLQLLQKIAQAYCSLTGRKMDLTALFKEFRLILSQEVDYSQEARLQGLYREKLLQFPGEHVSYRAPLPLSEICTKRVLGMERMPGVSLRQWIDAGPSMAERKRMAHGLLDLYFQEFFNWGLVQTDPNLGNYFVDQKSSHLQLILLDFGATREYTREFIDQYIELLKVSAQNDKQKARETAIRFGLIDARESVEAFEAFHELLAVAIRPFFRKSTSPADEFDFSDETHLQNSQKAGRNLANLLTYSPPPHHLIFLHRKLGGVYAILKKMQVKLDVSPYWEKAMSHQQTKFQLKRSMHIE